MKTKKITKKLTLSKTTVAILDNNEKGNIKGGYYATRLDDSCYTWDPVCPTLPATLCVVNTRIIATCQEITIVD